MTFRLLIIISLLMMCPALSRAEVVSVATLVQNTVERENETRVQSLPVVQTLPSVTAPPARDSDGHLTSRSEATTRIAVVDDSLYIPAKSSTLVNSKKVFYVYESRAIFVLVAFGISFIAIWRVRSGERAAAKVD